MSRRRTQRWRILAHAMVLVTALGLCTASDCDDDDDFDHDPAPGKGALVIDNNTRNDIGVFADGNFIGEADDNDVDEFDLDPGVYRVVLEERGGDHNWHGDIDILEGRNTILDVTYDDHNDYDVHDRFD